MNTKTLWLISLGFGAILAINALKEGSWSPLRSKASKVKPVHIGDARNPLSLRSGKAPRQVRQWKPL